MTERDIFDEALLLPTPAARTAYLDATCGTDLDLRRRVDRLLAASAGGSVLDRPASDLLDTLSDLDPVDSEPTEAVVRQLTPFLRPTSRPDALGRLGRYEVLSVLGQGGFGIVVRAFDTALERMVAVKVLAPHLAVTAPPRKRFLREARAAAKVRHENVVQIHAVESDPLPHQVMELVDGQTLQQRLDAAGLLLPADVARLGRQIALGLAAAHAQGLVHRDVKPANILLEGGLGRVKLTDFGLARTGDDAGQTQSGIVAGSPLYMAPEQAKGLPLDPRADLFSLGSVLYTMAAGRPPFQAPTTFGVLRRVVEDTPEPLRVVVPGTPPGLAAVIDRLLAKDPASRYPTAHAAADALADCLTVRPARRWPAAVAAVALLAAVAAGLALRPDGVVTGKHATTRSTASGEPLEPAAEWERRVSELPAGEQERAVATRLKALNPAFAAEKSVVVIRDGNVFRFDTEDSGRLKDISPLRAFPALRELRLFSDGSIGPGGGVEDITPLRGMQLTAFESICNPTVDLRPLADMPLTRVGLWFSLAGSVEPLRGKPITQLNLGGMRLKDYSVLRGMPLEEACFSMSDFSDLSVLADAPLTTLECEYTKVTDISPLTGKRIRTLGLRGAPVKDLSPIRGMPLDRITLDFVPEQHAALLGAIPTLKAINSQLAAEKPATPAVGQPDPNAMTAAEWRLYASRLAGAELSASVTARLQQLNPKLDLRTVRLLQLNDKVTDFYCENADRLTDASPLAALQDLRAVSFRAGGGAFDLAPLTGLRLTGFSSNGSQITSIEPLVAMPLEHVLLWASKVTDLSPLAGKKLTFLNVGSSPVSNVSVVKGMPLKLLNLNYTQVNDLSPLAGMDTLRELRIILCPVADLKPLTGLKLERLDMEECLAADLSPLATLPLKHLAITYDPSRHAKLLRGITTLQTINDRPAAEVLGDDGK